MREEDLMDLYDEEYHTITYRYVNSPQEVRLKNWQVTAILNTINIKKVLVSGCSGGELVRAFRDKNIKAWGFDISPDLDKFVIPKVKKFIKWGKMTDIPFKSKFDLFTAIDIFEHVPENLVDKMIDEIGRIGAKYLITLISIYPEHLGHVTIKSFEWWDDKLAKYYKKGKPINLKSIPKIYSLHPNYPHELLQIYEFKTPSK